MAAENQSKSPARDLSRKAVRWLLFGLVNGLVSCAVGPDYRIPDFGVPGEWSLTMEDPEEAAAAKNARYADGTALPDGGTMEEWWSGFTDETLDGLIADMRAANPSLKVALYRIDEAWAQRQVHRAGWLPHSGFNGRADRGFGDFDSDGVHIGNTDSRGEYASVDVGWEIDLFGARKRKIEASMAQHERAIEGWRDSLVFLSGEVALRYIDLRVAEEELKLREKTSEAYRRIFELIEGREEEGLSSKVEVGEARARLRAEEAKIPDLKKAAQIAKNEIARLCGGYLGEWDEVLSKPGVVPTPSKQVRLPIPADILRARPDVRAAERAVAREVAGLGVEIANLYPNFSLSGAITYELLIDGGATELFRRTIGGGAGIVQRLFHGGADRARIFEQEATVQQVASTYEEVVLRAITDVENALVSLYFGRDEIEALFEAEEAAAFAFYSLEDAFADGLIDLRDLLRSQQELSEVRLEGIFARASQARAGVNLFKAVGGGDLSEPPKHEEGEGIREPSARGPEWRLPWWKSRSYDVYRDFEG